MAGWLLVVSVRKRHICLVGFSGSGKSSVGPLLAKRLNLGFADMDSLIEKEYKDSISNIFAREGERGFRKLESLMIQRVLKKNKPVKVIALGGGAFVSQSNRTFIRDNSTVVWLSCSVHEIYRRLRAISDRPLLTVRSKPGESVREAQLRTISALLQKRTPTYRQSDTRVATTNRTTTQVVSKIIPLLRSFDVSR